MKTVYIALVVIGVHYLYYQVSDDPETQARWFYVLRGIGGTALFWMVSRNVGRGLPLVMCYWGMFEESQTAVCGIGTYELPIKGAGLCVSRFGIVPYAIISATAIIYLRYCHARQTQRDNRRHSGGNPVG